MTQNKKGEEGEKGEGGDEVEGRLASCGALRWRKNRVEDILCPVNGFASNSLKKHRWFHFRCI